MAKWTVKRNDEDRFDVLIDGAKFVLHSFATAREAGEALRDYRAEADYLSECAADEIRAENAWLRYAETPRLCDPPDDDPFPTLQDRIWEP